MDTEIIHLFLEIFVLLIAGFFFAKIGMFTAEMKTAISGFLLNVLFPLSILNSSQSAFSTASLSGFLSCFIFGLVSLVLTLLLVPRLLERFKVKPDKAKATAMMLTFSNCAFMGFPIAEQLYGETGLLYAVGYNIAFNLVLFSMGVSLLSGDGKMSFKGFIKKMATTPAMVAAVLALFLYLIPYRLPSVVKEALASAGGTLMPLSVLVIGYELAQIKFSKILLNLSAYLVSLVRLVIIPAAAVAILSLFRAEPMVIAVCALLVAMPSGTTNVILCTEYDCAPEYAAIATTQTMVWMLVVTPLFISAMNSWLF